MPVDQQSVKVALTGSQDVVRARVIETLERLGWNQTVLSERSGVARPTIYSFMSATRSLGELSFCKIAEAMNVSEEWLVGLSNTSDRGDAPDIKQPEQLSRDEAMEELREAFVQLEPDEQRLLIETAWAWAVAAQRRNAGEKRGRKPKPA